MKKLRYAVILVLGLSMSMTLSAQETIPIKSSRISELSEALVEGDQEALDDFWSDLEESGSPLVEPIAGDDSKVLVTFVWKGDEETRNVVIEGGFYGLAQEYRMLNRLANTDLWYRSYQTGNDLRISYSFTINHPLISAASLEDANSRNELSHADPWNDTPSPGAYSFVQLAGSEQESWIQKTKGVRFGRMEVEEKFESKILGNQRTLTIYTPTGYQTAGDPYPLVILFDGYYNSPIPTRRILANLIHDGALRPTVCVVMTNAPGMRSTELPCNPDFADFVAKELLPWIQKNYNVSKRSSEVVLGGSSYSALASSYVAFQYPGLFGNVLSQSGSYGWSPNVDYFEPDPSVEGEWLTRQYANAELKPIQFYIDVGLHEAGIPPNRVANRHFRTVLQAKGYKIVKYTEFNGGHEYINWQGSLADGLISLIGPK